MGPAKPEELEPAAAVSASFDERALVERARSDPSAFGALYRAYVDRIYAFAYRRRRRRVRPVAVPNRGQRARRPLPTRRAHPQRPGPAGPARPRRPPGRG